MLLRITPGDKRLKQLVKEHGYIWRFKKFNPGCQCFNGNPGYYAQSIDESHIRWIEKEFVEEINHDD